MPELIEIKPQSLGIHCPRRIWDSTGKGIFMELDIFIWGRQMDGKGEAVKERVVVVIRTPLFIPFDMPFCR